MKIAITEINDAGGGIRYMISPSSSLGNLPVGRIGTMVTVEVDDQLAIKLLDRQSDFMQLQLGLRDIYTGGTLKDLRYLGRML